MNEPLVSAVMLTGKHPSREALCQMALRCFLAQTWPNKELVIVNHGDWIVNTEGHPNIREFHIPKKHIGLMRQEYLARAAGEIIIQWDDDDISMPERMKVQATPIWKTPGVKATFLGSQIRYSLASNCALLGWNRRNAGIDGTICHRHNLKKFRFQDVKSREDSIFRRHFEKSQYVIQGDRLYIRLHHGDNIMAEPFIMYDLARKRNIWRLDTSHARLLIDALRRFMNIQVSVNGHRRIPPHVLPKELIGHRVF